MRKLLAVALAIGMPACSSDSPTTPAVVATTTTTTTTTLPPIFTASGTGTSVFDMPARVQRVRIQGTCTVSLCTFGVEIGNRLILFEALGVAGNPRTYDGTHQINVGGLVQVNGNNVSWSFTEVR